MPAQWTGVFVGKMHVHHITNEHLAKQMNIRSDYVSRVLNGHRNPKNAEQRFNEALNKLIAEKQNIAG